MVGFHTKLYIMLKASAAVNESFSMTAKVTQADVYAYIAKAKQLMKQKAASASGKTKAHYELLLKMLDINLK